MRFFRYLLALLPCIATAQTTYQSTLQGNFPTLNSYNRSCLSADDQQVLACDIMVNGDQQLALVKFDALGFVKWAFSYGDAGAEHACSVCRANDGGFIIAGTTTSYNANNIEDLFILRTDSVGTVQWMHRFADGSQFSPRDVAQTSNGNICVVGCYNVWTYAGQPHAAVMLVTDNTGNLISFKRMNFNRNYPVLMSVKPTQMGGFIMAGSTGHVWDFYGSMSIQTDASGTVQWITNLRSTTPNGNYNLWSAGDRTSSSAWAVTQLPNGDYVFGGFISDHDQYGTNYTFYDAMAYALDGNGNLLWTKQYPNGVSSGVFDMETTSAGNIAMAGWSQASASGFCYITQNNGTPVNSFDYSNTSPSQLYSINQATNGDLVMSGITANFGPNTNWLLRTDNTGDDHCASTPVNLNPNSFVYNAVTLPYVASNVINPSTHNWTKSCLCIPVNFACPPPVPPIDFAATGNCSGNPVPFSNLSHIYMYCPPTITWNYGDGQTDNVWDTTHVYSDTGTYVVTLTITDCSGNVTTVQHPVTIGPGVTVDLGNDTLLCMNQPLLLDAGNPGSTYQWSDGSSSQTINASQSGNYWVTVSQNGCHNSDTIALNFLGLLNMASIVDACDGSAATLDAGTVNGATYLWNTGDTTHAITVGDPGPYWVTVSAPGCTSSDTVNVEGGIGAGAMYIPNAFTPNDNGLNDVFTGVGADVTSFHLEIWNRWGQQIYVTDDINHGWDGKYKGEVVKNDVYVYVVNYTTSCAAIRSLRRIGHVWVGL